MTTTTTFNRDCNCDIFNQVEELVGAWASPTAMRSALFALQHEATFNMSKDIVPFPFAPQLNDMQMNLTENLARKYEAERGVHMHVGGNTCDENCNNPDGGIETPPRSTCRPLTGVQTTQYRVDERCAWTCDPYVNFDHSDCSKDECKFDDGAYL